MSEIKHALTLQRLAELKAEAAISASENGIKRTHALASIAQIEGFPSWEALMAQASKDLGIRGEVLRRAIAQEGRPEKPSESRQQRAQRFGNPTRTPFDATQHRESLVGFLSAYDNDDLPDGAWQAMLEDGAKAFSKEFGISIEPFDAFMEYVEHGSHA